MRVECRGECTSSMDHVYAEASFIGPAASWSGSYLVNAGATHSVLSPEIAEEIGATFINQADQFTVAGSRIMEAPRAYCEVSVQVNGTERRNVVFIWVVEGQDDPIIGAETLQLLGLKVDPGAERVEIARDWMMRLGTTFP